MADYDSSLPIRSEADGTDERVHVKVVDGTTPTQRMIVDTDSNAHVEAHGNDPAGLDRALRTSEQGSASVDGVYDGSNNTDPSQVGLVGMQRSDTPVDSQQVQRITSIENADGDVRALDVSLHDEDGEPYSSTNPMPVSIEESEGDERHEFNQANSVAAAASSNHDYVIADGDTFLLAGFKASASAKMRVELQIGDGGVSETFTTKYVDFNSTANPGIHGHLMKTLKVIGTVNGTTIRIVRTNIDNQPQNLYSTIIGVLN